MKMRVKRICSANSLLLSLRSVALSRRPPSAAADTTSRSGCGAGAAPEKLRRPSAPRSGLPPFTGHCPSVARPEHHSPSVAPSEPERPQRPSKASAQRGRRKRFVVLRGLKMYTTRPNASFLLLVGAEDIAKVNINAEVSR